MICWRKSEKRIGMSLTYNGQAIYFAKSYFYLQKVRSYSILSYLCKA